MSALGDLQQQFVDYLHNRPNTFLANVADTGGLAKAGRAGIYFNAYRIRLLDTLKDSFDKTWSWLGDERFESAALRYIADHPPSRFSLRPFGHAFADWLQAAWPDDPEVAELARLDWAMRQAFDAADAEPLTARTLAAFTDEDWARVVFRLHPSAQLLHMTRNTMDMWHAMDRSETPPGISVLAEPGWLIVWRKGFQPHFRSIDPLERRLLESIRQGLAFSAACEHLAQQVDEPTEVQTLIGRCLARWLDDELLASH